MSTGRALDLGTYWEGQVVDGRFQLQQYLGGGPDRAVFLTQLDGSKAVIKLILASSSVPDAQLATWHRAAALSHANLIRIFKCGRSRLGGKDILYIVSEYADENLGQVLPARALTANETESMLRPTLDALSYLHSRGLVHGRLRPSNVMAVYDQLKISSDSIREAGAAAEKSEVTMYDAPEAIGGRLFPAADVWALGVTLADALSEPVSSSATKEGVAYWDLPQPFADIVSHCLQRDPTSRWKLEDISTRLRTSAPIEKLPPAVDLSQTEQPGKTRRSWPIFTSASVALLAVLAIGYALLHYRSGLTPHTSRAPVVSTASSSQSGSDPLPTRVADVEGAVQNRVLPNPPQSAKNTIHGHIKVRVSVAVDPTGQVSSARLIQEGPSKYFARLAMEAAQQWKFTAPTLHGQPIASEWNLLFEFARDGTDVLPQKIESQSSTN